MSNFVNQITEMTYDSISDFITHYLEDVHEELYVTIYADWENTEKLISALVLVTTPVSIEYGIPGIIGYNKEYCISVVNTGDRDELFVEFAFNDEKNKYFSSIGDEDAMIIIGNVSDDFIQMALEKSNNIIKVSL